MESAIARRRRGVPQLAIGVATAIGVAAAGGAPARAEGADTGEPTREGEPAPATAPEVGLDALLRLPSAPPHGGTPSAAPVANPDREYWVSRFATVRGELDQARKSLADAQGQLEEMARKTENWQMAAPGAQVTPENSPISYKLRQEIRGYREDVDRAERRLRDLEVEASLAGVPPAWRQPAHEDATPD